MYSYDRYIILQHEEHNISKRVLNLIFIRHYTYANLFLFCDIIKYATLHKRILMIGILYFRMKNTIFLKEY
jgi:hypothetical protein